MKKTIDISGRLTNDKPILKLGEGLEFEVDNLKNTVFEVQEIAESTDYGELERMEVTLKRLLGEDAARKIDDLNLSFANYRFVFIAALATATGEDVEEVEARFQAEK